MTSACPGTRRYPASSQHVNRDNTDLICDPMSRHSYYHKPFVVLLFLIYAIIFDMTYSAPQNVAIIGAGAAGLACARAFSKLISKDVNIRVLEKEEGVAGVWRYEDRSSSSSNSHCKKIHPMYKNLRTNLPREIMGFREKPWGRWYCSEQDGLNEEKNIIDKNAYGDPDGMSYVTHSEVNDYLNDYADQFNLNQFIEFGSEVTHVKVLKPDEEWSPIEVKWRRKGVDNDDNKNTAKEEYQEVFDVVCIANGHYAAPAIAAELQKQAETFEGQVMHAVEYNEPSDFTGKTVLCIGARASGSDVAREISSHAKQVYLSDSTCPPLKVGERPQSCGNVMLMPRTLDIGERSVNFSSEYGTYTIDDVDTIIFCNGYDYDFPFIDHESNMGHLWTCKNGERRVAPLYAQLWHAQYPSLAFIGLPHSILPFPIFELQAEAIVNQFHSLNSLEDRVKSAMTDAESGGPTNPGRVQDTHFLGNFQWDYCRVLSRLAGNYGDSMEKYISGNKAIYDHAGKERKLLFPGGPDTYRRTKYSRNGVKGTFEVVSSEVKVNA